MILMVLSPVGGSVSPAGVMRIAAILCTCVVLAMFAAPALCGPPSYVDIPENWHVYWYQWLADGELAILYDGPNGIGLHQERISLKSGVHTALHGQFYSSMGLNGQYDLQLSPDGKNLLGVGNGGRRFMYDHQGDPVMALPLLGLASWAPDGREWLEGSLPPSGSSTTLRIVRLPDAQERLTTDIQEVTLQGQWAFPGFVSAGRVLATSPLPEMEDSGRQQVKIVDVTQSSMPDSQWTLRVPNLRGLVAAAVSPNRLDVCWSLFTKPANGADDDGALELWVSRTDGSRLRRIATLKNQRGVERLFLPESKIYDAACNLEWLSDGKSVSMLSFARILVVGVTPEPVAK